MEYSCSRVEIDGFVLHQAGTTDENMFMLESAAAALEKSNSSLSPRLLREIASGAECGNEHSPHASHTSAQTLLNTS
jgi:hypothetical protein